MKWVFVIALLMLPNVGAEIVAVSQLGYHPNSNKQIIVYTNAPNGSFSVFKDGNELANFPLAKAKNFNGETVECQGNQSCLIGNISFKDEGAYEIKTEFGDTKFSINSQVFADNIPILLEFFNAMLQQGSSYHSDLHSNFTPAFPAMADGSFIMVADQASTTLIRLGSAYRRNPEIFQADNYQINSEGKADILEYIKVYADYLKGLQGIVIEESDKGFRLNYGTKINHAFTPGITNISSVDVFSPSEEYIETVPVQSLCGKEMDCIERAAFVYKCQEDEVCLNISYIDKKGIANDQDGFAVRKGWEYEFGCYVDIDISTEQFADMNPCMVFNNETKREYTVRALHGFLEAMPAMYDYSPAEGRELLDRSIETYKYVKENFEPFDAEVDTGHFGAALFLLYDYTNQSIYLAEAYSLREKISPIFISDSTRGNEFYWLEYIAHKEDIESAGYDYPYDNRTPEEHINGKMFGDYKDSGEKSISNNGERVYQFDNNIQFQNSRYILTEGLLAAKLADSYPERADFVPEIADNQISFITGMNSVQDGVSLDSTKRSYSFIFGIGEHPTQFHSRYLFDSGLDGIRGTGFKFFNGSNYIFFDGSADILGFSLGSFGNGYRNETQTKGFLMNRTFSNGKTFIPGWINGPFDTSADNDSIFNYHDDFNTYEFTESTNEIVATAIELFAFQDGRLNNRTGKQVSFDIGSVNLSIYSLPISNVYLNGIEIGITDEEGNLTIRRISEGLYDLRVSKGGYNEHSEKINVTASQNIFNISLSPEQTVSAFGSSNTGGGDGGGSSGGGHYAPNNIAQEDSADIIIITPKKNISIVSLNYKEKLFSFEIQQIVVQLDKEAENLSLNISGEVMDAIRLDNLSWSVNASLGAGGYYISGIHVDGIYYPQNESFIIEESIELNVANSSFASSEGRLALRVQARDSRGIDSISGRLFKGNENFNIFLVLVNGTNQEGIWEWRLKDPAAGQYRLENIELSGKSGQKAYTLNKEVEIIKKKSWLGWMFGGLIIGSIMFSVVYLLRK